MNPTPISQDMIEAGAKEFRQAHQNCCYPDASVNEARWAAEAIYTAMHSASLQGIEGGVERLRAVLADARQAIASLDVGDLGWGEEPHDMLGKNIYPLRDELLANIDDVLEGGR